MRRSAFRVKRFLWRITRFHQRRKVQRSTFNCQTSTITLLFVGRLQARKRIDALLRACAELGTNPRLLIVGDGPERAALESLAKEIYPSAEFVGAKHGAELKPYFEQADLFVLPGTGGLAVQEAMSYGLPVIVAKGDGTQDDLSARGTTAGRSSLKIMTRWFP
jgi:glycosyltransferase involved in cell wall biosynthesis